MKNVLLSLAFIFSTILCVAQAPNQFKYQAVARNTAGDILANQSVGFEISILQGSSGGTSVYTETHAVTTNQHGLVSLNIGGGAVVSGSFAAIDWANNLYFIQVKMDASGGTAYVLMGTSQLLSVPYALNAQSVSSVDWSDISNVPADLADGDDDTNTDVLAGLACSANQVALWDGTQWTCANMPSPASQACGDAYGTSQITVLVTTTNYTLIPGLTQTINVPANSRVLVSTSGGVQCVATGVAFAAVDIGIHVDGVESPQSGQQRVIASNTDAVGQMITYWSMTKTYNLSAGTHTIDVRVRDAGGTADANVSGTNPLIQGVLTVTVLHL